MGIVVELFGDGDLKRIETSSLEEFEGALKALSLCRPSTTFQTTVLIKLGEIMGQVKITQEELDALSAKVDLLQASETRQEGRINLLIDGKEAQITTQTALIADLRATIVALQEADNGIPAASLQPALDKVDAIAAQLDAFKAAPVEPPSGDPAGSTENPAA